MVVLRAIGRFFARIGRWIKDTAWVQPLLIVGAIFGIIFSIKPISNAVSGWFVKGDASVEFYKAFQLSLQGAETGSSNADKLFYDMEHYGEPGYKNKILGTEEKFFVSFVKEDCENCKSCYEGFNTLRNEWGKSSFVMKGGKGFKMYTIFIDEVDSDSKLLIDDFLKNHISFFTQMNTQFMTVCQETESYYYYNNISSSSQASFISQLESIADTVGAQEEENADGFVAPTTYLFDASLEGVGKGIYDYISALFFNYTTDVDTGSTEFDKAYLLRDCWNYTSTGIFGKDYKAK